MSVGKELNRFEYKYSQVVLCAVENSYVVSAAQRIHMGVVLKANSTHADYADALRQYDSHCESIRSHRHCTGAVWELKCR